jgi:hypothetical protein
LLQLEVVVHKNLQADGANGWHVFSPYCTVDMSAVSI